MQSTVPRDLTSPRERKQYRIGDRRVVEMRDAFDLTVEEFERAESLFLGLGLILMKDARERTPEDIVIRKEITRELCTIALGDQAKADAIGDVRAMVVVNDFMDACAPIIGNLQASRGTAPAMESPKHFGPLSPDSPGSTPARARKSGSQKRRSG